MRLLVTGASGQLGGYLLREIERQGWPVTAWSGSRTGRLFGVDLQPVDLANSEQVRAAFHSAAPTTVIHAGAIAAMAECRGDPERARQINTQATALLAELAREKETRFLFISTDLVFDGEKGWYREEDPPSPLSVYAQSKAAAESAVLAIPRGLVVRVSLLFGPSLVDWSSFFDEQVRALRESRPLTLFSDEWRTPLSFATAARALLGIAEADATGILHVGGPERMSRLEMGQRLAAYLGVDCSTIVAVPRSGVPSPEPRPRDTSLDCSHWRALFPSLPWPGWHEALAEMGMNQKER